MIARFAIVAVAVLAAAPAVAQNTDIGVYGNGNNVQVTNYNLTVNQTQEFYGGGMARSDMGGGYDDPYAPRPRWCYGPYGLRRPLDPVEMSWGMRPGTRCPVPDGIGHVGY